MEKDIKTVVREKYASIAKASEPTACCEPSCCDGGVETVFNESYRHLEGYVPDADMSLGCGIPTDLANIQKGDVVLDLGSGAGNDVFVARSLTGATGKVIGIDMTPDMIQKAKGNQAKLGYENVDFILGDIEAMPLESSSIDVVISNCVLNLVPDKKQAYQEVFRVLKPGGHFSISDVVVQGVLTAEVKQAASLWAGCVSGAMDKQAYLDVIQDAGFSEIMIGKEKMIELPDELLRTYLSEEAVRNFRASGASVFSITVTAVKPV